MRYLPAGNKRIVEAGIYPYKCYGNKHRFLASKESIPAFQVEHMPDRGTGRVEVEALERRWSPVAGGREREQGAQAEQGKTWRRQIEWAVHVRSSFIISDHCL